MSMGYEEHDLQMSPRTIKLALAMGLASFAVLAPRPAGAQAPLADEWVVNSNVSYLDSPNSVACDGLANCAISWLKDDPSIYGTSLLVKSFGPHGDVLAERMVRDGEVSFAPYVVGLSRGFTVFWSLFTPFDSYPHDGITTLLIQAVDEDLANTGKTVSIDHLPPIETWGFFAGRLPEGYVVLGDGIDNPTQIGTGVFLLFLDNDAEPVSVRRVNEDVSGDETPYRANVAVDGSGNVISPFTREPFPAVEPVDKNIFFRRFSPAGEPLGPELRVNSYLPGIQTNPQTAAAPNGNFVIVWQSADQDGELEGIYAQRFSSAGLPVGPEFRVNNITRSAQHFPQVAVDSSGNFVVVWRSYISGGPNGSVLVWGPKARLFRADGTPVTGEILVDQNAFGDVRPLVAFAPNGTFIVTWESMTILTPDDFHHDIHARRFSASPGEEPCAVAGAQIFCDTGRTGGLPEMSRTFGGRPGEVTLLADADGDKREDVCAWYAGRFRCDLDHEGPPSEWTVLFGLTTDTPLFGDVDGDGRAEPCVRRKRRLLCDTAHDGGREETIIVLGRGTEIPLLGDLDADGKDDLCLVERSQWTCLTRAGIRTSFLFGAPGETPALGDLDRDGRAEPCVLRSGRLLCDTAHDGGSAETWLDLELPAGARPVFGNVDGL
jgi:hypothetical protein